MSSIEVKRAQVLRIEKETDVPIYLREDIIVVNDMIYLNNNDRYPLGSIIGYEKKRNAQRGYYCWLYANPEELIEIDGEFYQKV